MRQTDSAWNLIINAIEAADGDGQVKIRVARSQNDRAEEFEDETIVEGSDNGRGINEEDLARIFNPFFTTTPRKYWTRPSPPCAALHGHMAEVSKSNLP